MWNSISASELPRIAARRICIVKPSALGDVAQAMPLLPALRERFPDTRISWVVNRELSDVLAGHPDLDETIAFDRRGSWRDSLRLLRDLRGREFDLVIDLQGLLRTALMTAATRAPIRVGLETAREAAHLVCNVTLPDSGRMVPAWLRYWRVAEAFGVGNRSRVTLVAIPDTDRAWAHKLVGGLGEPVLAVHPGARWITKRWPVEKFAAVAAKATRKFGFATVILGSPAEAESSALLEQLIRNFIPAARVLNLTGQTTLKQLAAVLERVNVVLTNDTGPMHLAAGLGTPVVGVFTCTSAVRSGPPGDQHELVSTTLSCAARYKKRCPYRGRKHLACMEEVSTERVWQALCRVVERRTASKAA